MGTKKKTKTSSSGTQTSKPLDLVMPGYNQIASGVSRGLDQIQNVNYGGDFIAQPGDWQNMMPEMWAQASGNAGNTLPYGWNMLNMGSQMAGFGDSPSLASGMQSFGDTNPNGMTGAVNAAIDPYMRQLTEQILPSLQSSGIESGAYGGSRGQQTLPLMAIQQQGEQAQRVAAALAYEDFQNQQNRVLQGYGLSTERGLGQDAALSQRMGVTGSLMGDVINAGGAQAEMMGQGATADLANRQMSIDNALKRFQFDMTRPFMGYDTATDILSRLTSGYGTTASQNKSTTTESTSGLGPIVAGGLGLASMAAGLPMGGGASLGGSVLGSLFGGGGAVNPFTGLAGGIPGIPGIGG